MFVRIKKGVVETKKEKEQTSTFLLKEYGTVNFFKIITINAPHQHLTLRFSIIKSLDFFASLVYPT